MSKVTRGKLKFLIYILLQETNKINPKFFQILNDFLESTLLQAGLSCHESDFLLVGEVSTPFRSAQSRRPPDVLRPFRML